jgi:hypothetical protein
MSHFVVEHVFHGYPLFETITGVEDIDLDLFPGFQTLWVCESQEEVIAVENELRRKHNARRSQ